MSIFTKLMIVGCGNMGGAMLHGWLRSGEDPARFVVVDRSMRRVPDGVKLFNTIPDHGDHDCIMLGFKPQQLPELAPNLQPLAGHGISVFSLLAGIELASLQAALPDADAHVRVMPNLASRINKSPVILAQSGLDDPVRQAAVTQLFGALGEAFWLNKEAQFDLATALAGSGPGFVYRFIDALGEAGAELGLDNEMAKALAVMMVDGASTLAANSDIDPAGLADRVASPGGMTREGLNVLDDNMVLKGLLTRTLKATTDRGGALARLARQQG